jgi:AP endonuclease-2
MESPQTLTIVTWNCNGIASGIGANVKYTDSKELGAFFRQRLAADIVCMQETKLSKIPRELAVTDGHESFWASSLDRTGYSGVVTYASRRWSPVAARNVLFADENGDAAALPNADPLDREGRTCETDFGSFTLINVYVPNAGHGSKSRPVAGAGVGGGVSDGEEENEERGRRGEKLRFLRRLTQRVRDLHARDKSVIVVGDLNVAVHDADVSPLIGPIASVYGAEERAAFGELLAELKDAWRELHPVAEEAEDKGEAEDDGAEEAAGAGAGAGVGGGGGDDPRPPKPRGPSTFTVWDERTSARAFDRGLRIDYVLVSPRLLPLVRSAEILSKEVLPPKWSDHAALRVVFAIGGEAAAAEEADGAATTTAAPLLAPPPPHAPCALSSAVDERWALRPKGQKSIASFFAPKRAAGGGGGAGGEGGGAAAAAAKRQRHEDGG